MTRLFVLLFTCIGFCIPAQAGADYPTKPIVLVVPYAAGGSNDTLSRVLAEHMTKTLGQQVLVQNEPGAAGTIATTRTAKAAGDGYTIIMGNMGTHGAAPTQYPNLKYDPVKDFTPIGLAAEVPAIIVVRKDFPASSLKEFVSYVKANQKTINEAHVGVGAPTHIFCTLLQSLMGTKTGRVAYRGGAQAMNDLMGGQVDFSCISLSGAISHIQSGKLKAIAIASSKRAELLPDVPTTTEGGMPDFVVSTWNAVFAPKDLDPQVQAKLNRALVSALSDDATRKRLIKIGFVIPTADALTPQALGALVPSEVRRWSKVITPQ